MLKIAISGKAGSGKNTAASLIAENVLKLTKEQYQISAFATKIKEVTTFLFPNCNQEALYGPSELRQTTIESEINKFIETTVTFRQASVDIGKLGRSYNSNFWVAHIALDYSKLDVEKTKLYVISDLRFTEEFDWVKDNGFAIFRLKRDNLIKVNDISETAQDQLADDMFDFVIDNNGTLDELTKKLTTCLDAQFRNNKTYLQVRNANG